VLEEEKDDDFSRVIGDFDPILAVRGLDPGIDFKKGGLLALDSLEGLDGILGPDGNEGCRRRGEGKEKGREDSVHHRVSGVLWEWSTRLRPCGKNFGF
jgi:hypothetical protein